MLSKFFTSMVNVVWFQKYLSQVFVIFQRYPTKMFSCDFRRFIEISDKIYMGPLETLKK